MGEYSVLCQSLLGFARWEFYFQIFLCVCNLPVMDQGFWLLWLSIVGWEISNRRRQKYLFHPTIQSQSNALLRTEIQWLYLAVELIGKINFLGISGCFQENTIDSHLVSEFFHIVIDIFINKNQKFFNYPNSLCKDNYDLLLLPITQKQFFKYLSDLLVIFITDNSSISLWY